MMRKFPRIRKPAGVGQNKSFIYSKLNEWAVYVMPDYTILIVDYEPRAIDAARKVLEGAGYRIEAANNGNAGVVAFKRLNPDLTLVAAMLPRRQGLEVCRELKATEHGGTAPVLVLASRFQGRRIVGEARRSGAAGCVFKPIVEQELLEIVQGHLPLHQPAAEEPQPAVVGSAESEISERLDAVLTGGPVEPAAGPRGTSDPERSA